MGLVKIISSKKFIYIIFVLLVLVLIYAFITLNKSKQLQLKLSDVETKLNESNDDLEDYKSLWEATKLYHNGSESEAKLILERFEKRDDTVFLKDIDLLFKQNSLKPSTEFSKIIVVDKTDNFEAEISEKDSLIIKTQKELSNTKQKLSLLEKQSKESKKTKDTLSLVSSKGVKFQYFGEIMQGKANGYGVGVFETGSIYKGYWYHNSRQGHGIFTWVDGEYYEGDFVSDKRQGKGKYYWKNGEKFEGEWFDDQRNGYGILYKSNGKVKMEGNWMSDKLKKSNASF